MTIERHFISLFGLGYIVYMIILTKSPISAKPQPKGFRHNQFDVIIEKGEDIENLVVAEKAVSFDLLEMDKWIR